jgi:hypothetical protein
MPRYFFNLMNLDEVRDCEGMVLGSAAEARDEAIRSARDIMAEEVRHGRLPLSHRIEVADEQGQPILAVPFREAVTIED